MLPAVSRSGMTISTSLALGIDRKTAADFSFLLSIPAILAAVVMDVYDIIQTGENTLASIGAGPLVLGMIFAAVSGFFAVKVMIKMIQNRKLRFFLVFMGAGCLNLLGSIGPAHCFLIYQMPEDPCLYRRGINNFCFSGGPLKGI